MTILKNEPVFPFKENDYSKPRHIIAAVSYAEIGFDLATLAKNEYGCRLGLYDAPIYAEARREYLASIWSDAGENQGRTTSLWLA